MEAGEVEEDELCKGGVLTMEEEGMIEHRMVCWWKEFDGWREIPTEKTFTNTCREKSEAENMEMRYASMTTSRFSSCVGRKERGFILYPPGLRKHSERGGVESNSLLRVEGISSKPTAPFLT
jgi:hypothetical protein